MKDEHCRQLEAALDGLDSELNKISRSRHELSILRLEEVEEDDGLSVTKDGALLTHLDNRLGHLEREQRTLQEERTSLKVRKGHCPNPNDKQRTIRLDNFLARITCWPRIRSSKK